MAVYRNQTSNLAAKALMMGWRYAPIVLLVMAESWVVLLQESKWGRNWRGNRLKLQTPESDEEFYLIELQKT